METPCMASALLGLGGDLGEEDILWTLNRAAFLHVANAECREVKHRQGAAEDKDDVARNAHPLEHGIGVAADIIQGAGVVVTDANGMVKLEHPERKQGGEDHPSEAGVE